MHTLYQTRSVADLKANANTILKQSQSGPVVILSRATPKAVLVSPDLWNETTGRLTDLERILDSARRSKEMASDPAICIPFTLDEHVKRGLLNGLTPTKPTPAPDSPPQSVYAHPACHKCA